MNIKQLCTEYNIQYNSKNPKRSLDKLRKEYIVTEISPKNYVVDRPLTDEEKNVLTKFTKCREMLQDVICSQLVNAETNKIRSDTKGFLEMFGIVNSHYKMFSYEELTEEKIKFLENINLPNAVVSCFYEDVHPILNDMLKSVFRKMESEFLIMKQDIMMYAKRHYYKDNDGKTHWYVDKIEPNADEKEEFMRIGTELFPKYNIKSWDEASNLTKKKINAEICAQMGWAYVYNDYEIILNRKGIKQRYTMSQLNNEVCTKILNSKQGELKNYDRELLEDCIKSLIKIKTS